MQEEYINKNAEDKIFVFLNNHPNVYAISESSMKNFLEAIFWISRTGVQWRFLPKQYGKWNSVFKRFIRWAKKDIWEDLMNFCADEPDLEYVMLDSTTIRSRACCVGYGSQKNRL